MTIFTISKTRGSKVGDLARYHEGQQDDQAGCDDYYLKGTAGTQSAFFTGSALGVAGIKEGNTPKPGDYEKLFNGYRIDNGEDFLSPEKRKDLEENNRVQVYSTAFNMDKTISVFYAAASKEQQAAILRAMQKAADNTMRYAEQEGKFTVRNGHAGQGGNEKASIMAACYAHVTSRSVDGQPPDPQLHVHVEIANFGITKDGRILSLDGRSLYERQAEMRALFDVDFFRQLENEGVDLSTFENEFIDTQGKVGYGLQTKAVSKEQKDVNSKRRFQILDVFDGRTDVMGNAKSKANLSTRSAKEYEIDYVELHKGWKESIGELNHEAEGSRKPPTKLQVEAVLFKGRSVSTINDLERTAAQLAIGDSRGLAAIEIKKQEIIDELGIIYCKDNNKITTKDFVKMEGELLRYAIRNRESDKHSVKESDVTAAIKRFEERETEKRNESFILNEEQNKAVYHLANGDFAIMQGAAGTGKSATLGAVQEVYKARGYTVTGIAPSNSAAQGLAKDGIDNATTIQKLLLQIESKKRELKNTDIIFFDEAGMAGTRELHTLTHYVEKAGAKLVLVGDGQQLEAVGSASAFAMLSHEDAAGAAELQQIARQNHEEDRAIATAWLKGKPGEAWEMSKARESPGKRPQVLACGALDNPDKTDPEDVKEYDKNVAVLETMKRDNSRSALDAAAEGYLKDLRGSFNKGADVLLLADTRADVRALNNKIREERIESGEVDDEQGLDFKFHLGGDKFRDERIAKGDRVMFRKGDRDMGVVNGTTGTITGRSTRTDEEGRTHNVLTVELDNGHKTSIKQSYDGLELSYATTVHKSQGMTVQYSHYLASEMASRRGAYVAGTRAKEAHTTYLDVNSAARIESGVRDFKSKETAIHAVRAGYELVALQEWQLQSQKVQALIDEQPNSQRLLDRLDEIQDRISGLEQTIERKQNEAAAPEGVAGWAVQTGGFDALSDADQAKAAEAHAAWQAGDPQTRAYGLHSYVNYVQEKHAEAARLESVKQEETAAQEPERKDVTPPSIADVQASLDAKAVSLPQHGISTQMDLGGERMSEETAEKGTAGEYDTQELWTSTEALDMLTSEGLLSAVQAQQLQEGEQRTRQGAWIAQSGGFGELSEEGQAAAREAHAEWLGAGEAEYRTFGLEEYVSYVQERHAGERQQVEQAAPAPVPAEAAEPATKSQPATIPQPRGEEPAPRSYADFLPTDETPPTPEPAKPEAKPTASDVMASLNAVIAENSQAGDQGDEQTRKKSKDRLAGQSTKAAEKAAQARADAPALGEMEVEKIDVDGEKPQEQKQQKKPEKERDAWSDAEDEYKRDRSPASSNDGPELG